jgi:hypothetical protein
VDVAGNSYVVGATTATNYPTVATGGLLSATNHGGFDAFVTVLNADASAITYSAYLGGTVDDFGYGIATDAAGNAYVVGQTASLDFPVVGALQPALDGSANAFIMKITADTPGLLTSLAGGNLQLTWPAFPPGYVLETSSLLSAGAVWTVVPQTPVTLGGYSTVSLPASGAGAFYRLHRH